MPLVRNRYRPDKTVSVRPLVNNSVDVAGYVLEHGLPAALSVESVRGAAGIQRAVLVHSYGLDIPDRLWPLVCRRTYAAVHAHQPGCSALRRIERRCVYNGICDETVRRYGDCRHETSRFCPLVGYYVDISRQTDDVRLVSLICIEYQFIDSMIGNRPVRRNLHGLDPTPALIVGEYHGVDGTGNMNNTTRRHARPAQVQGVNCLADRTGRFAAAAGRMQPCFQRQTAGRSQPGRGYYRNTSLRRSKSHGLPDLPR